MKRGLMLAVVFAAGAARADIFDTFGFGPRATAMGGAMTAEANDYTAVFYNPAMLIVRKEANFGASVSYFHPSMDVSSTETGRTVDCTYCAPPDTVGESLGLVGLLGGKLQNRVAVGVGLHLPFQRLLHVQLADPNRPYWYNFASNSERIEVFLGAGIRIFDWLNLGIGAQALADLVGKGAETQVDLFSKQVKVRQIDSELRARVAPVFGLLVAPIPKLRFGVNFRWEMALQVQIPATVDIEGVGTLAFSVDGYTHYSPHTLSFGAAWDVTDNFTLALDGEWQHWSAAPSPYVNINFDLSGDTLKALGLDTALDLQSPQQSPGFVDTVSARLGAEFRITPRFAARVGFNYRPTHVPKQNAPGTNILDGTTIAANAGIGFNFDDPLEIFAAPIRIDLGATAMFILPRTAEKEPTDVVPTYTYSGKVLGVNAAVRYDF